MASPQERFTTTQQVTRPLSPRLMDLCLFVDYIKRRGYMIAPASGGHGELTDQHLAQLAEDFWDMQHGED